MKKMRTIHIDTYNLAKENIKHLKQKIAEWQKTIDKYEEEDKIEKEFEQKQREANCGEHYYLPAGKYSRASEMYCQFCRKRIN